MPKMKSNPAATRRERVGKVTVEESTVQATKYTPMRKRWRTWCRRKSVAKEDQIREHESWDHAVAFASKLNEAILTGKVKPTDEPTLIKLREIHEKIKTSNLLGKRSLNSRLYANVLEENTLETIVEVGLTTLSVVDEVNTERKRVGLSTYSLDWFMNDFKDNARIDVRKHSLPTYEKSIARFVAMKTGPNGGRGNKELEPPSKKEWRQVMGVISGWIGASSVGDYDGLEKRIQNMINLKRGLNGAASEGTKFRYAEKTKEFGAWLVGEDYWEKNHFRRLPKLFAYSKTSAAATFRPEQVEKLFQIALTKEKYIKLIPYISFLFFAGPRPTELANVNDPSVRFKWKRMDEWKIESDVTGGVLYDQPVRDENGVRISKGARDRQPDLTGNGLAWMQWWADRYNGGKLPTTGEMFFSKKPWNDLRKEAGLYQSWVKDIARHSYTSYAHWNRNWKVVEDYWLRSCGHSAATYKDHYEKKKALKDCEAYFNILPPKTK